MQNGATLRHALRKQDYELPRVSDDVQHSEKMRNSLLELQISCSTSRAMPAKNAAHINARRRLKQLDNVRIVDAT